MINWWLFPLLCTIGAIFLIGLVSSDRNLPYCEFMLIAALIVIAPLLTLMWLFCFLISMIHP